MRVGDTATGNVVMGKYNNGNFTSLDNSMNFTMISVDDWVQFLITVTPTTVSLGVSIDGGPPDQTVTLNDADHRGPYAFYGWEDDHTLPADNAGFIHGYSAYETFATTSPMYEDNS